MFCLFSWSDHHAAGICWIRPFSDCLAEFHHLFFIRSECKTVVQLRWKENMNSPMRTDFHFLFYACFLTFLCFWKSHFNITKSCCLQFALHALLSEVSIYKPNNSDFFPGTSWLESQQLMHYCSMQVYFLSLVSSFLFGCFPKEKLVLSACVSSVFTSFCLLRSIHYT